MLIILKLIAFLIRALQVFRFYKVALPAASQQKYSAFDRVRTSTNYFSKKKLNDTTFSIKNVLSKKIKHGTHVSKEKRSMQYLSVFVD